jgi:hypothetical protein
MTGADRVAKPTPDGYTFLQGTVGTQAQNQTLFRSRPTIRPRTLRLSR